MIEPLVFLHAERGKAATGRNARKRARSERCGQRTTGGSLQGHQCTFALLPRPTRKVVSKHESLTYEPTRSELDNRQCLQSVGHVSRALQPHICLDDLLGRASLQIRHVVVRVARAQIICNVKLLRCRQWASGSFAKGAQHPTIELFSAVVCLEHYIKRSSEGTGSDIAGLVKYSNAIRTLQQALRDPDHRLHSSVLAAAHVLTLASFLMVEDHCDWEKHISGVTEIAKFHISKADDIHKRYIRDKAAPVFLECLLARHAKQIEQDLSSVADVAASEQGYFPAEVVDEFTHSVTSLNSWLQR